MKRKNVKRLFAFCLILTLLLTSFTCAFAETSIPTKVITYDEDRYWDWGINIGSSVLYSNYLFTGYRKMNIYLNNTSSEVLSYNLICKSTGKTITSRTVSSGSDDSVDISNLSSSYKYYLKFTTKSYFNFSVMIQ